MMIEHEGAGSLEDSPITGDSLNTDPDPPTVCHRCGSTNVVATRCASGPHFARVRCLECGRTVFAKTPWSIERARAFTMPWGKYRDRQLADLTETEEGLGYLRWLAANIEGNASTAAGILLDSVATTGSDVSSRNKKPAAGGSVGGLCEDDTPFCRSEGIVS
jgi:uncharacterized protein (DUF3820 family)